MSEDIEIRRELYDQATRRNRNIQAWLEEQGAKIRAARPPQVFNACLLMALEHCRRQSWRMLTAEQIKLCERRALSTARVHKFGALPQDGTVWWGQLQELAAEWGITLVYDEWGSKKSLQREAA